jgi:HD-GYP domain-containing protein (c-di-GMP phosphodiesterase class II)
LSMFKTSMVEIIGSSISKGRVPFSIYKIDSHGVPMLFCKAGYEITERRYELLKENENRFYIQREELSDYIEYASDRINDIIKNPDISHDEKIDLVKRVGNRTIHRIIKDPEKAADRKTTNEFINGYVDVIVNLPSVKDNLFSVAQSGGKYLLSRSFNVCTLCLLVGKELLGNKLRSMRNLGIGGLLLDVGMTKIEEDIVEKHGPLNEREMDTVMLHPFHGDVILSQHDFNRDILAMVRQHHERIDGSGYPHGLYANEIHPFAQIAGVVDTYDAITSERPYKATDSHISALEQILDDIDRYNVVVVRTLLKVVLKEKRLVDYFTNEYRLDEIRQEGIYTFGKEKQTEIEEETENA